MKATLCFDYDEYTDVLAHRRAISATDAFLVLHCIIQELRDNDDEKNSEMVYRLLEKYDVNMDHLE